MKRKTLLIGLAVMPFLFSSCGSTAENADSSTEIMEIHPDPGSGYWNYRGERTMLLGGSVEDNLFQVPDVAAHLDLLKSAGGNYVRCTMSSRDEGNEWPFSINDDGLYDLHDPNPVYWKRFADFLAAAEERGIIVQVEIWATFDFYRDNWEVNPFNPVNNVNYDQKRSKLSSKVPTHPIFTENNFFRSVPSQMALAPVLRAQQLFVDQLLSISLQHENVLYCMDNETSVTSDWGKFWADYIREKGRSANVFVNTTEMWDPWELDHPFHAETFMNPQIYNFVDISQNNHQTGDVHWDNGLRVMEKIRQRAIRPVNNVKIYGNDGGRHKTTRNGIENFVQNVLMGCASARFHRPTSGQGLNETAQSVIRSMRMLTDEEGFFEGKADNGVFVKRTEDQQYCRVLPGDKYIVYFTRAGRASLDTGDKVKEFRIRWLNVMESAWQEEISLPGNGILEIETPGEGDWIALISAGS